MYEKSYGSNMLMMTMVIAVVSLIAGTFNATVFGWLLSAQQIIIVLLIFATFMYYVSYIKKVYLYQDEIVFRKILSTESVSYSDIHRIALNEKYAMSEEQKQIYKRHSDSIDYFVLLDKNGNALMSIYVGLIGGQRKQAEFISILLEKNKNIITE